MKIHCLGPKKLLRAAFLLCIGVFLLAGCAQKAPRTPLVGPAPNAEALWSQFAQTQAKIFVPKTLDATASLQYKGRRAGRVNVRFWGDFSRPLRLDLSAGFGTTVALVREDASRLVCYYPQDKLALYSHTGPQAALDAGLPLPFTLQDLALLMAGAYPSLAAQKYSRADIQPNGNWKYFFSHGTVASITLDSIGQPVELTGQHKTLGWTLLLGRYTDEEGQNPRPKKLELRLSTGDIAILRTKNFSLDSTQWNAKALALELPPETLLRPMDSRLQPEN